MLIQSPWYEYIDEANNITPEDNLLTKYINPNNKEYTYTYYDNKQIKTVTVPSGLVASYTYDGKGNPNSVELSSGDLKLSESITYTYSNGSLPNYSVKATDQRGKTATWRYDANDGTLTGYTDPNGNTTTYTYNTLNDTEKSIKSGDQVVEYTYSSDYKHRTGITRGNTIYRFTYDEYGNTVKTEVGDRILAANNYYDNNGNLQTVTYGNGDNMSYAYDSFGNVSLLVKDNKNVAKYYANGRGDIVKYVDLVNDLEHRANFDTTGRLISKDVYTKDSNSWVRSVEYDYDLLNNISKLSFAYDNGTSNITNYSYDSNNRPIKAILQSGKTFRHYYDGLNRVTKSQLNTTTPIKTEYTYVNIGSDTTTFLDTEVSNAFAYSYFYDNNGNITKIQNGTKQSDGSYSYNNSTGNAYTYDQYNQLIRDLDNDNATSTHYEYDTNGNITKRIINSWDVAGNYPIKNLVTDYFTYSDSSWGDLLTSYTESGSKTAVTYNITYDAIGNPLNYRDGMTMTWVNGRELASISKDGKTLNFTYDPDGLRTKKSITSSTGSTTNVEYVYEDGLLRQMTYGSYVLDFSYDANGTPVAFHVDNGGTVDKYYYYGVNSRGDVEALYNADGTLHAKYEYDVYGKLMSVKASDGTDIAATYAIAVLNPLRYRGYVYDTETGLYYLQSRYYDPTTCRFINADGYVSTGQGITGNNMFAYCNNNPVMYGDTTGYCMKAWAEGYQGPCPGLGKPGCMDYNKPSDPMTFITKRDVTEEVNDALWPEVLTAKIVTKGLEQLNDYEKTIPQAGVLYYFKTRVDHEAPWDIKRPDPWKNTIGTPYPGSSNTKVIYNGHIMTLEALGNYTYGYIGRAYGIPLEVLLAGSYYAAGFPTEGAALSNEINVDWNYVTMGYYGQ